MAKTLNILLIEDNANDAELARANLKKFTVSCVDSLKAGLAALETAKFDCVLLDLNLFNGKKETVLHEVNAKRGQAATVILTGDGNPRMRDTMLHLGADGFMVKGVDDASREDMEWVIFRALEHRKLTR